MNVNMNLNHGNLIVILIYTRLKMYSSPGANESIKTELLKDTEKAVKCAN